MIAVTLSPMEETIGDFLVAAPIGQRDENLPLARRQLGHAGSDEPVLATDLLGIISQLERLGRQ